jgi:hypothetical protein
MEYTLDPPGLRSQLDSSRLSRYYSSSFTLIRLVDSYTFSIYTLGRYSSTLAKSSTCGASY